jgi:hypothetical protein
MENNRGLCGDGFLGIFPTEAHRGKMENEKWKMIYGK